MSTHIKYEGKEIYKIIQDNQINHQVLLFYWCIFQIWGSKQENLIKGSAEK